MSDYLTSIKQIADGLALVEESISESSLMSSVLAGLDVEYLPVCLLDKWKGRNNLAGVPCHSHNI